MSDTTAELQLVKFEQANQALDELKTRFDLLAEAGNKLQQSFETLTKSFLAINRIAPVIVPFPTVQLGTAEQGGDTGGSLQKFGEKALEKFVDKTIGAIVDWPFKKLLGEKESAKTKNQIGFRVPEKPEASSGSWMNKLASSGKFGSVLAGPVSKAGAGRTTALVLGTVGAGYGAGSLLNNAIRGDSGKTPKDTGRQQAASAIAAMPVFVTNWPSGPGRTEMQAGGSRNKIADQALTTFANKGVDNLFNYASKKLNDAGGVLSLISKVPSFLPASWLGGLAGMGKAGAALAAPVGTAGAATTAGLVTATAAAGYGLGTLLNKGMGWVSGKMTGGKYGGEGWMGSMIYDLMNPSETKVQNQNTINVALKVDKDNRLQAETKDMNTKVNLKRGDLVNTGDK